MIKLLLSLAFFVTALYSVVYSFEEGELRRVIAILGSLFCLILGWMFTDIAYLAFLWLLLTFMLFSMFSSWDGNSGWYKGGEE